MVQGATYTTTFPLTENPLSEGGNWIDTGSDLCALRSSQGGVHLGLLARGLVFLWADNTAQTDPLRVGVVQNFNRVAVEDTNHLTGELASDGGRA
jgi:hypothetical protein